MPKPKTARLAATPKAKWLIFGPDHPRRRAAPAATAFSARRRSRPIRCCCGPSTGAAHRHSHASTLQTSLPLRGERSASALPSWFKWIARARAQARAASWAEWVCSRMSC